MSHRIQPGVYKHYKGNLYNVIGIARHTETSEEFVVYQALYGNYDLWVRPFAMFIESVIWNEESVPRFELVEVTGDNP